MITGTPDPSINMIRLEREIRAFRSEITAASQWVFREKFVDRGRQADPFYIIQFKQGTADGGDDLMDEPLFATRHTAVRIKHITRQKEGSGQAYWRPIGGNGLVARLERFMSMYREDYCQPPGTKGDLHNPDRQHDRFEKKRFVYQIGSPRQSIIGVGPKMFAGSAQFGAIRGTVTDENGNVLGNTQIELVSEAQVTKRSTDVEGKFWITTAAPGLHKLHVPGKLAQVHIVDEECFGNVKGTVTRERAMAYEGRGVELTAPDDTVIAAAIDSQGRFTTGPLPAFPYILKIPGFLFTAATTVVADAEVVGTLMDERGGLLKEIDLTLSFDGAEQARTSSDGNGRFTFSGLTCGNFSLAVPGYRIYVRRSSSSTIQGTISGVTGPVRIELMARQQVMGTTHSDTDGTYGFQDMKPGDYAIRAVGHRIAKVGPRHD